MKKLKHKRLAEGEATGHSHTAVADDAEVYAENETVFDRELRTPSGTEITHEEHKTIKLPAGEYDITIQKEFDPMEREIRQVRD